MRKCLNNVIVLNRTKTCKAGKVRSYRAALEFWLAGLVLEQGLYELCISVGLLDNVLDRLVVRVLVVILDDLGKLCLKRVVWVVLVLVFFQQSVV